METKHSKHPIVYTHDALSNINRHLLKHLLEVLSLYDG